MERPARLPRQSPVRPHDAHPALGAVIAETQFCSGKQAIDDHVIGAHPVIDELGCLALRADDEQWRHLALGNAARKLDVDSSASSKACNGRHGGLSPSMA